MYILLISIVIGLFVAMLFVNVYFRVKVLKSYRKLIKARVEFGAAHLFNKEKNKQERRGDECFQANLCLQIEHLIDKLGSNKRALLHFQRRKTKFFQHRDRAAKGKVLASSSS